MEATRSSFNTKVAIGLSAILLAAVMLVCIPQGQALATDTAPDAQSNMRLATFGDPSADLQGTEAASANAPQQASGVKAKYGLLMKNGTIYPCNSKGKKLGKAFKAGSTVRAIFVDKKAKKLPALTRTKYWVYPSWGTVKAKVKTIKFLGKKSRVTTIAKNAYKGHSSLKKVVNLNKTKVKTIPNYAFANTSLSAIKLPKTVTKIGSYAFFGTKIKGMAFPTGLTSIGDQAFARTANIKGTINLSKTRLATIGEFAFAESNAQAVLLPSTVKTIKKEAFAQMPYLINVGGLANTQIAALEYGAFESSPRITNVALPRTCKSVGYGAFYGCTAFNSLTLNSETKVSGSSLMFSGTRIAAGSGTIRIPAALRADYTTDYYWSDYRTLFVS